MFNPNTNLVINSNMEAYAFELSKEGEISYNIFNSSLKPLGSKTLDYKGVKLYSIFIDLHDIIHLVALLNTGHLSYSKYNKGKWSQNLIANFDLNSNIYNQIEILVFDNTLHIFYNYSNKINSNIWTIQHVIYGETMKEGHNCIRYISKQNPDPFFVDSDSLGTINLLYGTSSDNHFQIYHIFYSPYTKKWSSIPKKISSNNINSFHPFLFIDSQDNLHSLLLEDVNLHHKIKYLRMSSKGKEKFMWKEINLPNMFSSNYTPIILEENGILKIIYISDSSIEYIYSKDYGYSWILSNVSSDFDENISMIKVPSNLSLSNYNLKYGYVSLFDKPSISSSNLYIDKENKVAKLPKEIVHENSVEVIEEITINSLNETNIKIDKIIDICNSNQSNQFIIEKKLNDLQKSLDEKNQSFFSRFFNLFKY